MIRYDLKIHNDNINFQRKCKEYEKSLESIKDANASEKSELEKKKNELEQANLFFQNKLQEYEQRLKQAENKFFKVETERDIYKLQLKRLQDQTIQVNKILNNKEQM